MRQLNQFNVTNRTNTHAERNVSSIENEQASYCHKFIAHEVDRVSSKRDVPCTIGGIVNFDNGSSVRVDESQVGT